MYSSEKFPLNIKSSTIHTEFWTLASFREEIENSGSWIQFSRAGTSDTWQAGMSSDNSYVIRASDAANDLTVNQNGDTSIIGNLDVESVTIDAGSYTMGKIPVGDTTAYESFNGNVNGFNLNPQSQMSFVACATNAGSTVNHIGLCCLNRASTYSSYTPAISFSAWVHYCGAELNHIGAIASQQKQIQGQRHLEGDMVFVTKDSTNVLGEAFRIYDGKAASFASKLTINGNLNVGPTQSVTSIKAYVNHAGHQGNVKIEARWRSQGFIHVNTDYSEGLLLFAVKDDLYMLCALNIIYILQTNNTCIR